MVFQKASPNEFDRIRAFYWALIDAMAADNDKIGWKKGIYPTDEFLRDSLERGTLYTLTHQQQLAACVIVNSDTNEGYAGVLWRVGTCSSPTPWRSPRRCRGRGSAERWWRRCRIWSGVLENGQCCTPGWASSSSRPSPCSTRTPGGRSTSCMSGPASLDLSPVFH